jgi:hypothetical protein
MMMAHPYLYSLICRWLLQNSIEGLIICCSYRSLGNYDMSFLTILEGKHCTYEGASLARTYNSLGVIDEEITMNFKRV